MMKRLLLLLTLFVPLTVSFAQNCEPMDSLPNDQVAIFPLPAGIIPPANGGIGINQVATIGEPFNYTWTLSIPQNYNAGGVPTTADSTIILVDSIYFEKDGVRTPGLPDGLSLVFEPDQGVIIPTDQNNPTLACFAVTGIPSTDLEPGDYNLFFVISNCVSVTGFSGCINSTIPSAEAMLPGLYTLTIEEARVPNCQPIDGLPDDQVSIFPLPAGIIPPANGGIGINQVATIGEPFSYTWTLSIPKNYSAGGIPTTADSTIILVDSTYYEKDGVSVPGLPEGLSLVFEPENGVIVPTEENNPAVACFAITGVPSMNLEPGDYNLFFVISNCVSVTGFSGCINSTIPSAEAMLPGLYTLSIEEEEAPNCQPMEELPADQVAIFPLPLGIIPPENGGVGINQEATIGEPFNYTWTLSIPKEYSAGGIPTTADSTIILIDSIYYEKDGVRTSGLPEGLTLVMDPDDGVIVPTEQNTPALACFAVTGTPSENLEPGDYNLFFVISNCVSVTGFSGCINSTIPSAAAMLPGLYTLTINSGSTSTRNMLAEGLSVNIAPNPFREKADIRINSSVFQEVRFTVYNWIGQSIEQRHLTLNEGLNIIEFQSGSLSSGIYIYSLENESGRISGKMVIER